VTTTLTITRTSHGHSNGDLVIVRNANADNFSGIISNVTANTFDVTTANTGAASGAAAAYSLGFTSTSASATASTVTAPSGGDVQLLSMLISESMTGDYALTLPTSSKNGAGENTSIYNSYPPVIRLFISGSTTVGPNFTLTSSANVFNIASTGTGDRTLRADF